MSNYFSDLEGLRLAVEIENRGFEFYRLAHDQTTDQSHKLLFGFLMQEELNHASKFKSMYENLLQKKDVANDDYLYDPETSRYLKVLVETHIFPENATISTEPELANGVLATGWQWQTPGQSSSALATVTILRMALQAEKDSILFYDEMMNNARFPEARQIFAELKAEEQTHVIKLQEMIAALSK